jgi:hypothetical protein
MPAWVTHLKRLSPAKGVAIKSLDGISYIGAGLADEEVYYLYCLIKNTVAIRVESPPEQG